MRRRFLFLFPFSLVVGASFVALLSACGESSKNPSSATMVLFDLSKSTSGKTVRNNYYDILQTIIDNTHGQFAVNIIDADPLAHSGLPINEYFPSYSVTSNRLTYDAQRKEMIKNALRKGKHVLAYRAPRSGTAILDSLTLAQNYFNSYPSVKSRYLVILSDMVEVSGRDKFTQRSLLPKYVARFLRKEKRDGELPDLRGVTVYLVGAGVKVGSDLPSKAIQEVEKFWLRYFAASGANLTPNRYGPTLIRFP